MKTIGELHREVDETKIQLNKASETLAARKQLFSKLSEIERELALRLIALGVKPISDYDQEPRSWYADEAPQLYPHWSVSGVPSKAGRPLAHEWMQRSNVHWKGDAPTLRRAVVAALKRGEEVPHFGLSIRLSTVRFELD